ncbi:ABC transporter substrate-binding protein [Leucobacter komagatae]|uniref:Solute-binding protein family 5 domain-containing protein n=1 Tax=Leucobacter komagatae TaxID=55969 RepID=A0A0D0ING4_9MICO|nr:ABC transporter substrate-binding protein [Leucobacter komagatae]KIP53109.1 hypothetical protein SD72_04485 [Leucobacter komagatae]
MNSKKPLFGCLAAAAAVALLASCASGAADSEAERALRVAVATDASSLDPIRGNSGGDHVLLFPIYDTLISYTTDLEAAPGLAAEWELVTPTELTLTLREGVTFHDGTPLNAAAVKYNIDRAQGEGSNILSDVASVDEVRVDDELTATLVLAEPDAGLLMALSDRAGMMVSPTAAEAAGGDLSTAPVGAGGWQFGEWRRGESLRVERFDEYWDAASVRAPALTFSMLPEPKTRVGSLRGGQQDIVIDVAPSDAGALETESDVKLFRAPRVNNNMIFINTGSAELGDPLVRRALSIAIDREALLESGFFGYGRVGHSVFPEGYWAAPPASVEYDYDPDEARRLLAEAGAQALIFDLTIVADAQTTRIAEILKDQWAEVGVTVNLLPREVVQQAQEFFVDKEYPAMFSQWTGRPDPAMTYGLAFTAEGFFNPSGLEAPGLAEALAAQNEYLESADRKPGLDRAAEAVFAFTPSFPLVFVDSLVGLGEGVEGFELSLLGKAKFGGVTVR